LRAYTVAATAVTLGVSKKWVDNVLSHYRVYGVHQAKQGILRRVTPAGLITLEIALSLNRALGVPTARALKLSNELISAGGREVRLAGSPSISLRADVDTMARALNARLERALEMTPIPKRGRPGYK
jgi:hypothetical protein